MSYESFSKGSEWHKWDLHIHSNSSDGTMTPEEIIKKALERGIRVIALTDHHTTSNIDKIKSLGETSGIKVISGIEFRTEYGSTSVHMIGLFPDKHNGQDLNSKTLHEQILCPLGLSETSIIAEGKKSGATLSNQDSFKKGMFLKQVDFKKAANLIHKLGGLVSVHAGNKSNSIEEMKHEGTSPKNVKALYDSLGPVKEELLSDFVNICEIRKNNDDAKFYLETFNKPSIIASDAHTTDEVGSKYTWIKADPTFEGLKQILWEQIERVKIQEIKPDEKKPYNVIEKIRFKDSTGKKIFSEKEIGLSAGLNAIIGGKSSGKSLLLYMLAQTLGNGTDIKDYSVITNGIELEVYYADDVNTKRTPQDKRIIEYLPQLYIEKIVRDQKNAKNYFNTFISSLVRQTKAIDDEYILHERNLSELNINLNKSITNWIDLDKKLNSEIESLKPMGDKIAISKEISSLDKKILELSEKSGLSEQELTSYNSLNTKNAEITSNIEKTHLTINSLLRLKDYSESKLLNDIKESILFIDSDHETEAILSKFKGKIVSGLGNEIKSLSSEIASKIREKEIAVIALAQEMESNNKILAPLIEKNKAQTEIKKYKEQKDAENIKLAMILAKERAIESTKATRDSINFMDDYAKIFTSYNSLTTKLNEIIKNNWDQNKTGITLDASAVFDSDNFVSSLSQNINMKSYLETQFSESGFKESKYIFSDNHQNNIKSMLRSATCDGNRFGNFKGAGNTEMLLRSLIKDYNYINFDIKKGDDHLNYMSEGKKGIVVLQLYLSLSKSDCPILIDQPEDNLDNRTVYTELNDYIKDCKKRRQIIMVSHNANLVVNTDAENVIVANQMGEDGKDNKEFRFEYVNGPLESTFQDLSEKGILYQKGIREHVCEILEGGTDAFQKREKKYQLHSR